MIDWTLDLISVVKPTTWTLENVSNPILNKYNKAHVFKLQDYGVPQTRRRTIICDGFDHENIVKSQQISSIETLERFIVRPVDWTKYEAISSGSYNRYFRSIYKPCYTIVNHKQCFRNIEDKSIVILSYKESSVFQTFPMNYIVHDGKMVANAVTPEFARRLVESLQK